MRVSRVIALVVPVLLAANSVYPCGFCREDNRAAVYSQAAMDKVKADSNHLEFVVLKVAGALPKKVIRELHAWLSQQDGIDAATLKISGFQKSIGFVWQRSRSKDSLVSALQGEFPDLVFQVLQYEGS